MHKVSADLCLLFQMLGVNIWAQLWKRLNVLNTWTKLELQLILLRTYPEHSGGFQMHSSNRIETAKKDVLFWSQTGWTLGWHISPPERNSPRAQINRIFFFTKLSFSKWEKALQCYPRFVKNYRNYVPWKAEKRNHFRSCWKRNHQSKSYWSSKEHLIFWTKLKDPSQLASK